MTSSRADLCLIAPRRLAVAALALATALLGTLLATILGAGPASADAPAGAPAPGSRYVALGDSYAAGYGIGTSTGQPVAGCAQSTQDYPHQIAAALKLDLTDVSCSGAVTANIDTTPQNTGNGTAPLQDTALTPATKLVTVSIGGNDLGFADIAQYCLANSAQGPLLLHPPELNCKAHYAPTGGTDTLAARVQNVVVPAVARVLSDIHAKAPGAQVYFVDYPAISTTMAGSPNPNTYPDSCYSTYAAPNSFPFTGVDTEYLQDVQVALNNGLKAQVATSGDNFVESYPQSLSHSACAGTPAPWLNGITLDPQTLSAKPGSLHPNLIGATHLADETLAAIGPYVAPAPSTSAPASSPASSSASSSAQPTSATTTAGAAPQANASTAPIADTGTKVRGPLLVGLLLVLAGGGVLMIVRRAPRPGARRR